MSHAICCGSESLPVASSPGGGQTRTFAGHPFQEGVADVITGRSCGGELQRLRDGERREDLRSGECSGRVEEGYGALRGVVGSRIEEGSSFVGGAVGGRRCP